MFEQPSRTFTLDDSFFSVAEAAAHIRCSESFVWSLIARKKITPVRIGKRTIVPGSELKRFMRAAAVAE